MTVCNRPLYAGEGDLNVKCRACGAIYQVAERRAQMALDAREYLLTKVDMLQAIPELMGDAGNLSDARFRQWVARGKLEGRGPDIMGRETYKVGDVLNLLDKAEATARMEEAR